MSAMQLMLADVDRQAIVEDCTRPGENLAGPFAEQLLELITSLGIPAVRSPVLDLGATSCGPAATAGRWAGRMPRKDDFEGENALSRCAGRIVGLTSNSLLAS
ncbi:hypothetical protein J2X34_000809 [Rhodococcus sp. BE178]